MKQKSSVIVLAVSLGGLLTVIITMLAFVPFLNNLFAVETVPVQSAEITAAPQAASPEESLVTVYYIMEENSKKISEIYVEVFLAGKDTISYLKLPVDTKVDLSEELYKSLQTYAPELPQHLRLSNMAESFSEGYGLTGGNRILSEVIGKSLSGYVRTDAVSFRDFLELQEGGTSPAEFFERYAGWLEASVSDRTTMERWAYYESRQKIRQVVVEEAPGSREKDGFLLSSKRSGEWLEKKLLGTVE